MRTVAQRVSEARVTSDGHTLGAIGPGLLVLVGVAVSDTPDDAAWLARKLVELRIFADDEGRMNRSLLDTGGDLLVVSQFTLFASTRKGARPSFNEAARPAEAIPLYETFLRECERARGRPAACGRFGADMQVSLINDGPVTLLLDSKVRE
jgi:D-tyrosyl-tRNA(Tyr) deacylase